MKLFKRKMEKERRTYCIIPENIKTVEDIVEVLKAFNIHLNTTKESTFERLEPFVQNKLIKMNSFNV